MSEFRGIINALLIVQLGAAAPLLASVTVNLDAGRLRESAAAQMNPGALLLLVASGADGAFSNDTVEASRFVAGDDVVLAAAPFNDNNGPDFTSSALTFTIAAGAQTGQRLALRWFPRTTFAEYAAGATPSAGQPFGTYNPRMYAENVSDNPDGAAEWILPGDGATADLRFFTSDSAAAGTQPPVAGHARFVVQTTPEATATPSPTPSPVPSPAASASPSASPAGPASPTPGNSPSPPVTAAPHLANIASRLHVGTADNVLIAGFILRGTGDKPVVVRGIGPSLSLPGRLADPVLELYDSGGQQIAANDNWQSDENAAEVAASTLAPPAETEPALFRRLAASDTTFYTAVVSGKGGTTGIGVVELYDLDQNGPVQFVNISTRGFVQRGDDVMIGSVIVTGSGEADLVVRAIGPSLDLPNNLADPLLELFDNNGLRIATNNNWKEDQQGAIEASSLQPQNDNESAIRISLKAGNYTAIVSGVAGGTGVGLVEIYKLSP